MMLPGCLTIGSETHPGRLTTRSTMSLAAASFSRLWRMAASSDFVAQRVLRELDTAMLLCGEAVSGLKRRFRQLDGRNPMRRDVSIVA
jgi:hypothetical protein